jgi:hypothetical protein
LQGRKQTVVEFILPENNTSIFAKECKLYLPSKAYLKETIGIELIEVAPQYIVIIAILK